MAQGAVKTDQRGGWEAEQFEGMNRDTVSLGAEGCRGNRRS